MESKQEFVMAILNGLAKMKEMNCPRTEIYTIGVSGSVVSPSGETFAARYVKISRVANSEICGIEVQCCKKNKQSFVLPVNNEEEAENATDWLLKNECMPDIKSMRRLVIPAQFIDF